MHINDKARKQKNGNTNKKNSATISMLTTQEELWPQTWTKKNTQTHILQAPFKISQTIIR